MYRFTLIPHTEEIDEHMEKKINSLRSELYGAVDRSSKFVKAQAQLHLTGEFLRVRTGRLRGSVGSEAKVQPGAIFGIIGTNVWYGQLWETGRAINESGQLVELQERPRRPWLSMAMFRKFQTVKKQLTDAVKKALEK